MDTGPAILRNIDLHIEPGKKIGIVGRTGRYVLLYKEETGKAF